MKDEAGDVYSSFILPPSSFDSHRLVLHGLIVDAQQLALVEDHFLPCEADDVVGVRELDRIDRTRLFAHAAVDAPELVDDKHFRVFLAVRPRRGAATMSMQWAGQAVEHM